MKKKDMFGKRVELRGRFTVLVRREPLQLHVDEKKKEHVRLYTVLVRREPLQLNVDGKRKTTYQGSAWNIEAASTQEDLLHRSNSCVQEGQAMREDSAIGSFPWRT